MKDTKDTKQDSPAAKKLLAKLQAALEQEDTTEGKVNAALTLLYEASKKKKKEGQDSSEQDSSTAYASALHRYLAPTYVVPETVKIPTANLARNIAKIDSTTPEAMQGIPYPVDKSPHTHFVYAALLDKIAEQYPIKPVDKCILVALGNLYAERKARGATGIQGGAIITAEDIIRLYRGQDLTAKITDADTAYIQKRMNDLMHLYVSFDFSQHFEYNNVGDEIQLAIPDEMKRKLTDEQAAQLPEKLKKKYEGGTVVRFSYVGAMVHANIIEVEYDSGRIEQAYEILTPPIVYDYAEKIKQIQRVETKLLDIRKKLNSSRDADVIKYYLIEQINAMKHGTRNTRIRLATMFDELRIKVTSRKTKKTKVDIAKKVLAHFSTVNAKGKKPPLIKGYKEITGYRRSLEALEVIL